MHKKKRLSSAVLLLLIAFGCLALMGCPDDDGGGGADILVSIGNAVVLEGNAGTATLVFPVTLSTAADADVTITYSTADGTATAASGDYEAAGDDANIVITAGERLGAIRVTVNGDRVVEMNERLTVRLEATSAGDLDEEASIATGTIENDDVNLLYMVTNPDGPSAVAAFSHNPATGLTSIGNFATEGTGNSEIAGLQQHAIVANNTRVYAVNPGSDTVSAFSIETDGSLTLIGAPVPSGGPIPTSLALHDTLLYVANAGHVPGTPRQPSSYRGFRIQADGSLMPLPACPDPVPTTAPAGEEATVADIVFNAEGSLLIASGLAFNRLESFQVNADGCLVTPPMVAEVIGGPFGAAFNPVIPNQYVVTIAEPLLGDEAPGVASYTVAATGALTRRDLFTDPDTSDAGLRDPCWIVFTPDGQRFWTSSFVPRSLTLFEIAADGTLTPGSEFNPGDSVPNPPGPPIVVGSTDIVLDRAGNFLYQLRAFDVRFVTMPDDGEAVRPRISVLRVTGDFDTDAGLEAVETLVLPANLSVAGVMGLALVEPL